MNKQKIKQLIQQVKKEKSSEKRQLQIVLILEMIVESL
jgi:6-phosphofructokinase|tara:strand:+ start:225 stop:338 length:114 start_codon:yes stop_codon:yes gene_type:complete